MFGFWLRKIFFCIVFVNIGLLEERCRVVKFEEEIEVLDDDSIDIFMLNIYVIERYSDRLSFVFDDLVESNYICNFELIFLLLIIKFNNG